MTNHVSSHDSATLDMPFPRLSEGRFSSCTVLTDEALYEATGVRIAFTQRTGGVSAAPFDSLNLGDHVNDRPESVAENRRILLDALGAADASVVQPRQIHGDRIVVCDALDGLASCQADAYEGADGVVVRANDVMALLCFADCVPVIAVAPTGSFSVVHAGWRGVASRIVEKAVAMLCSAEGVSPSLVDVYIGPHIRQCHFEVGDDLAARFSDAFGADTVSGRFVDLSAALKRSLAACGIDERRIADAGACTVCDGGKRYYSYRASGGTCGRHAAVAVRVSERGRSGASCLSNSAMPQ